ncbi:MAG: alpha/beta fold hydrolase [Rhodospirillales bacterium]|nr:alpha/beta fold hydrolase [Rhodospirillales bacterium]
MVNLDRLSGGLSWIQLWFSSREKIILSIRFATMICGAVLFAGLPAMVRAEIDPLFTDPPRDTAHPARMEVVHIPSHDARMNGVLYLAAGAGPHPTLVFFHGLPGNEQNLDLAQGVRRLGWNVLTLHYRGSWGSSGTYSYSHLVEDGVAALEFVRDTGTASQFGIDPRRIVLVGYSTGGFVAVNAAASAGGVAGLVLISATDDAAEAETARRSPESWRKFVAENYSDSMETLTGCTPEGLANELLAHGNVWSFAAAVPALKTVPVFVITADDGFAPEGEALAHSVQAAGDTVRVIHMGTDHAYSDHRIALQRAVADWLRAAAN